MTLAPKTFGAEVGDGMAQLANSWVSTSNTLQQQAQQRAQQEADNAYRQQQAAQQASYQSATLAQGQQGLDLAAAREQANLGITATDERMKHFQNVIGPAYAAEYQGLSQAAQSYGPRTDKGLPNPNFDPARFAHATDRMKALKRLMQDVNLNTQNEDGYRAASRSLLTFLGTADDGAPASPATSQAPMPSAPVQPPLSVAPPLIDMTFPAATAPRGDRLGNADPGTLPSAAPVQATPAPPTTSPAAPAITAPAAPTADLSTYQRVQDVPVTQLLTADDASLVKQFGEGAQDYARSARGLYKAKQDEAQTTAIAAQNKLWDTRLTAILTDTANPASPKQVDAATLITGLNSKKAAGYELSPEEDAQYRQAVVDLARDVYSPKAWQDVLGSKDDTQITAMYKVFQNLAPGVIPAAFDIAPYQTRLDDAHRKATQAALLDQSNADAATQGSKTKLLLGGAASVSDVITNKDTVTLRRVAGDPDALKFFGYTDGSLLLNAAQEIERGVRAGTDKVVAGTTGEDQTNRTKLLLGGSASVAEVISKGDSATLRRVSADPAGLKLLGYTDGGRTLVAAANQIDRQKAATEGKTVAELLGANAGAGAKLLAQLSAYPMTMNYDQIVKGSGGEKGLVANLKRLLGVNDNGAANLIEQAQYQYGLGLRGKELTNKLAQARIDTQTAMQGSYDASAAQTTALTPVKVGEGKARTDLAVAQTGTANANTSQITQLTPVKVNQGNARTAQINAAITDNRNRTNAYVDGVRQGTLPLDAARIAVFNQQTLAYRMRNPKDSLYDPSFAKAASGTFYGDLAKQAALYTGQANVAAKQVGLLQKSISALTAKAKLPFGGGIDLKQLTADDQTKLADLNAQLDHQMQIVAHRSAAADQVISDGLKNAPQPAAPKSGPRSAPPAIAPSGFRTQSDGVAQRVGVNPQHLYAFFGAESSFGQNTSNYKGMDYAGPGQIGAAAQADVNKTFGLNLDRNDPPQNMEIAARYYKILSQKYGSDPQKIYAAYNMGGGNLDAHLKANGGKLNVAALPAETQTGLGNLMAGLRGYGQDGKTQAPPKATAGPVVTPTGTRPPAPVAPAANPASQASAVTKWAAPSASLPPGVQPVGSVTQYAQDLRQRGWFVRAAQAKDQKELMGLIGQATRYALPTGTAEQRLAFQRDLFDSMAGLK